MKKRMTRTALIVAIRSAIGVFAQPRFTVDAYHVISVPMASAVWDEELEAAGAHFLELPATDNRACCDNAQKITALFAQTGFTLTRVWSESIDYRWRPEDYFDYQMRSTSRLRLMSLDEGDREACLSRIRKRLSGSDDEQYFYGGEVVMAIARKADAGGLTLGEDNG